MIIFTSLIIKRQGKYLYWDSFKAEWKWGPKRLSEKFSIFGYPNLSRGRIRSVLDMFPDANVAFIKEGTL